MPTPILATKLFIPPPRPQFVPRLHLIERLNAGLHHKLTLISAAAGFGKTTLVSEWVVGSQRPTAWLSLDESDSDPPRFLSYLIAAVQTIAPTIGAGVLTVLQAPQPPPVDVLLTALLNEIASIPQPFALVLDDYHVLDSQPIDQALTFLLKHLPPQMHLVIATREDPMLPLAQLRARGQLTELRVSDLRFTHAEAAGFLNQVMQLNLSAEAIAALEKRTEGWIAGLQLAALSMQGHQDTASFIQSFTGSHHFVLDYLAEEVLQQQPESVQTFLLHTAILDRLCGGLCDAVLGDSSANGQATLEYIERANLFIIPLDSERRWYRYHHLFADLLRQRLHQSMTADAVAALHLRASAWLEANGLEIEAFEHAAAAHDVDQAARIIEGKGMPLLFRGAAVPILNWLKSLPAAELDARPALWVMYASALLFVSQIVGVEEKLQAAETALENTPLDDVTKDLIGHIASIRATMAVLQIDVENIITQSHRALEYLHPNNLAVRTATTWTLGVAHQLQGDRAAASRAYTEALATSQAIGHGIISLMSTISLGNVQEFDNQLALAEQTYRQVLQMVGEPPLPVTCEAYLGLARIHYARNDMEAAQQHGQLSVQLARQFAKSDRFVASEVFLARLRFARGDVAGADAILTQAIGFMKQHGLMLRLPEVAAVQVLVLLHRGDLEAAASLAHAHPIPMSQARVYLAQGKPSAALAVLEPLRHLAETNRWADERLKVRVLQAVALHQQGDVDAALQMLGEALTLAVPEGFIRVFVDEGLPMAELLSQAAGRGVMPETVNKLLMILAAEKEQGGDQSRIPAAQPLIEPLSQRELEVLRLIAQGYSNHEICEYLFLALNTVKGHNQRIFGKLQVDRRTEAVARARELGLL